MFKLVALFAALAVAAAEVAPLAYNAGAWPYSAGVLPYSAGVLPYSAGAWPYSYSAGAYPYNTAYSGYVSPYSYPYNYGFRSALAPAVPLDPVNKVPLDTPEVVAAKVSHFQAKALAESGIHAVPLDTPEVAAAKLEHLKAHAVQKRSVVAPLAYNAYPHVAGYPYSSSWVSPYNVPAVSAYSSLYPSALGYRGYYPYQY